MTAGISLMAATLAVASTVAPSLQTPARRSLTYRLGPARLPAGFLAFLLLALVAGVPIGNLMVKAGLVVSQAAGEPVRSWSPARLIETVAPCVWDYRDEFAWTLLVSGLAATAAVAGGAVLAWTARHGGWRAVPALTVVAPGITLPGPLIGLAVIWLLDRSTPSLLAWAYDRTILAPVLAVLIRVLPLAVVFCWFVLRSVSDDMLDAAAVDGAGGWTRFCRIAVPQRWAGLTAAWLAVFAVAAGDLACSILVVPPGISTVPIRIFGLLHAGVDDQVAGICLTVIAWMTLQVMAVHWLLAMHVNRCTMPHRPDRQL
jgi:iron(III) transport system permease protein